jgi:RNA polymerase sigma factor (sigma-70 family)
LRRAALGPHGGGLSDGQLLRAFLNEHDECAFEALVRRHVPMVMGVCRRILRHAQDAEDAFQAAFLVLVRKAGSLAGREIVGDWLHGTALRTALKARSIHARRRGRERYMAKPEATAADFAPESHALLDQELQGLPEKYRVPIILCELEGRTHREAAKQLGCPIGTLSGRLSRARTMLARRLKRRGVTLSATGLAASLGVEATAGVNQSLVGTTVKAATQIAAGRAASGIISSQAAALMEGVVRAMLLNKLKMLVTISIVVVFLGLGAGSLRHAEAADGNAGKPGEGRPADTRIPVPPATAPRNRQFQVSFAVAEVKDGKTKQIALPRLTTTNGKEAGINVGGEIAQTINNKVRFITTGLTIRALVSADVAENPELDLTVTLTAPEIIEEKNKTVVASESVRLLQGIQLDKPVSVELTSKDKDGRTIRVTATVKEVVSENTLASAEKDLKVAEFYRRCGKLEAAQYVFELILRRYPDTLYARQAREQLAAMKKEHPAQPPEPKNPSRIGHIVIIGNSTLTDGEILDTVALYPGEVFTPQRLYKSEWKLLESGLFADPPKISITYENSDSDFKDITIKIEE